MSGLPFNEFEALVRLAFVSVLLFVVLLLSRSKRIGIGREFALGLVKGGAQLALLAVLLTLIFTSPLWYIWTAILIPVMLLLAGRTSARRAGGMPGADVLATISITAGAGAALAVLVVTGAMPMGPQFIIPLAGMSIGNAMVICSLTVDRLVGEARTNRGRIEAALALGATPAQAFAGLQAHSVRSALIPTIDRLRTLGVIFIPGAMAGLIIAGTSPIVAAEYQMIVYLMIVGGGIITAMIAAEQARARVFNEAEQVENWVR